MKRNKIICGICVLICTALAIAYLFAVPAIFISNSKSNTETRGVVTMLVNADGTPMIYEKGR